MESQDFVENLESGEAPSLGRDIPDDAMQGFWSCEKLSNGIENLRDYGLTEFEIGTVVGAYKQFETQQEQKGSHQNTQQTKENNEVMFG